MAPGGNIEIGEQPCTLDLAASGQKTFTIRVPAPGRYALFTEHTAEEFALRLQDRAGKALRPICVKGYAAGHTHDDTVTSVGIELEGEVDADRFNRWLGKLLRERGVDIFRSKGILNIKGETNRYVFQGVHMLLDGAPDPAGGAGLPQLTGPSPHETEIQREIPRNDQGRSSRL